MTFGIGSRVGPYEIIGLLGTGGMGEVHLARDTRLGREVAIKALPPELASDRERLARLEREAKTVASLSHPNIVTLYGIEEAGDTRLLVMERVQGRPLSSLVDAGPLPVPRLLQLAVPIADALAAAHDKGIVHRDLKPANVMVGDRDQVKVLDFGLAKTAGRGGPDATTMAGGAITEEGRALGTVPYMAPEQLKGERVDARADIFAFGAMLYEMASGVRPFRGDSTMEVAAAVLREEPQPLEARRADLPPRLTRLVERCLAKDPRDRVQSAIDLRHELQDLADEVRRPVPAPGTSKDAGTVASAGGGRSGRRAGGVAIAVAVAAVAAGALVVWALKDRPTAPSAATGIRSIAVLPFDNLTRDASQDYFVDGMHDALITELARLGTVRVTSRGSVMRYKEQPASLKAVAQDLGVDALIEGSVLRADNQVRVTAQLILGATDEHVWADRYDRDLEDVLTLLSEVSHAIAAEVQVHLGGQAPPEPAHAFLQVKPEAYDAYLRGRSALSQGVDADTIAEARGHFEEAVRIDPRFADAWGGIAGCTLINGLFGREPAAEAAAAAGEAAQKALALDPDNGTGLGALGTIDLYFNWRFDAARERLERALQLNPHDAMLCHVYSDYLMIVGRLEESLEQVLIGRDNEPGSPLANLVVVTHMIFARHYEEAVAEARRVAGRFPNQEGPAREVVGDVRWLQGRYEEALAELKASWGTDNPGWQAFDEGFRRGGPQAAYEAYCASLLARATERPPSVYSMANCYAYAGDPDATFAWLEKAYAARLPQLLHALVDPAFDSVRHDPRFEDLLRRIGISAPGGD